MLHPIFRKKKNVSGGVSQSKHGAEYDNKHVEESMGLFWLPSVADRRGRRVLAF
jgi:hypothetical protein